MVDGQDTRFMSSVGFQQLFLRRIGNIMQKSEKEEIKAPIAVSTPAERNRLNIRARPLKSKPIFTPPIGMHGDGKLSPS
jgi:hypothetical protein